jgi:hypothetical protein
MTEKRIIHEGDDGVAYRVVLTDVDGNPVNPGAGGPGADYEIVVTTYRATAAATGYSSGDTITATRAIEITDSEMAQVNATLWFNETTGLSLASAPTAAHLTVAGAPGLTDAQLRASAVPVRSTPANGTLTNRSGTITTGVFCWNCYYASRIRNVCTILSEPYKCLIR